MIFFSSFLSVLGLIIDLACIFSVIYFQVSDHLTILLCLAENEVQTLHVSLWPVRGHFLSPLHLSEQVGIINEVAFSWILTSLSAGLPHSVIGAIGLGLRPEIGEAEKGRK